MFQVLSGDSWASGVSRGLFEEGKTDPQIAFFFISFFLINSVMMLNVVVAVLLDEFIASVARAKEEEEALEQAARDRLKVTGCLDELTKMLVTFEDAEQLTFKISEIYDRLDEDDSGGLTFEEFSSAVKSIKRNIHMTKDDFDVITDSGRLLGSTDEFNAQQFQEMMKGELKRYSKREINNVLSVSGDESFRSLILMLKILQMEMNTSLNDISARLGSPIGCSTQPEGEGGGGGGGAGGGETSRASLAATEKASEHNLNTLAQAIEAQGAQLNELQSSLSMVLVALGLPSVSPAANMTRKAHLRYAKRSPT